MIWEMAATLSAGLFAGAADYVSLVEHPARVECGTELALTQFGPSYRRAAVVQALFAFSGLMAGIGAWLSGSGVGWLVGGSYLGIRDSIYAGRDFPNQQAAPRSRAGSDFARSESTAVTRWARLHMVRSALGVTAFVVFVFLLEFRV